MQLYYYNCLVFNRASEIKLNVCERMFFKKFTVDSNSLRVQKHESKSYFSVLNIFHEVISIFMRSGMSVFWGNIDWRKQKLVDFFSQNQGLTTTPPLPYPTPIAKQGRVVISRSSHPEVFLIKSVLKIWSKFAREQPCRMWFQ